jgi:hypothetical protein
MRRTFFWPLNTFASIGVTLIVPSRTIDPRVDPT